MDQSAKRILFLDDDADFLVMVTDLFGQMSQNSWEVFTAPDMGTALATVASGKLDLLVTDLHMPVVDGVQFLKFVHRKHPNLLKVVLTSDATGAYRDACLNSGADLFLEKPRSDPDWQTLFNALNELAKCQPEEGFRGVLRRVGLSDVLQMECLARNSSVLDISAGDLHGTIYIEEGQIVHAQVGDLRGEEAFNYLMRLTGGQFALRPFSPPDERTISGSWEGVLMAAAQHKDEIEPVPPADENWAPSGEAAAAPQSLSADLAPAGPGKPVTQEMLICSAQGDVLYEWHCQNTNTRIDFLEFLSQRARQISRRLPVGNFDRIELEGDGARVVCQIHPDRAMFVRTTTTDG